MIITRTKGFTLIEVLLVIALFSILLSLGLVFDTNLLKRKNLSTERDVVVGLLQAARQLSLDNDQSLAHGFCIGGDVYAVFEGDHCVHSSFIREVPINESVLFEADSLKEIVFEPLSGNSSWSGAITLTADGEGVTIRVNKFGAISY